MRHLRMLGLCLVAAFAVAAVAATSASALPEFGKCEVQPKHEGKYTNNVCTKKAKLIEVEGKKVGTGEFEWKKATEIESEKRHFLGTAGAGVLVGNYVLCESQQVRAEKCHEGETESTAALKVECESEGNHGEISGVKTVAHISVVFHGCKALGSIPCSNTLKEGEIQVNTLKGSIGFINKATTPRQVGLLLEPAVKKGEFAKFSCLEGQLGTVVGVGDEAEGCAYPLPACGGDGIIAPMTPVNTMTSEFTQAFAVNEEAAENVPNKLEGKPLRVLESYIFNIEKPEFTSKWSKAGETVTNTAVDCAHNPENKATECPNGEKEIGEIKAN